ncbi:murein hydrolase activator EnvC family protein [Sporolactobacillus pectinivorans]|uniref:murein hydrolase activator EnvC family protein n=1 Tax=Sporolactobacillus pectinivorans TaxID=1591408 RepID=UPI000C266761|nr:M23 family metallopeptidase [Sporolactobacillus pectinivorans]
MKKAKVIRRAATACLAIVLATGFNATLVSAETQSQLNEKLAAVKQKQISNQNDLNVSKKQLSQNNKRQNDVLTGIIESQKQIDNMNGKIAKKQADISQNQQGVAQLKTDIKSIGKRIDMRGKLLGERIRSIYINGGAISYLDVLMGSSSFGNFIDRLLAVKTITDQDNKIINDQKKDKTAQLEKQKLVQNKLDQTRWDLASLTTLNRNLNREEENQKSLLSQLKQKASDINSAVMNKNEEASILQAQASVINQQITSLSKEETLKKAAAADAKKKAGLSGSNSSASSSSSVSALTNGSSNGAPSVAGTAQPQQAPVPAVAPTAQGNFIKPAAGVISSGFGYRTFDHSFHPGIDIANSTGTPIHAAADGIVFKAYQSSSYGNCVMISHFISGQTYTTVYAHLSSYNVSDGQKVSQGQVIGAMGATGEAFGSHLHFELYIGPWTPPPHTGAVDPEKYISQ